MEATQPQQRRKASIVADPSALTLTREQAARRLQISVSMVDALVKAGKLGHFRAGRRVLFNDDHLVEYLQSIQRSTRAA